MIRALAVCAVVFIACKGEPRATTEEPPVEKPPATPPIEVPPEVLDKPPVAEPAAPTGPARALLIAEGGAWVAAEGKEPKKVAVTKEGIDTAALGMELDLLQSAASGTRLDIAAEDRVRYQEIVTAMDTALAKGMTAVSLVSPGELPVKLPPAGTKAPARCADGAMKGGARPAEGASAPIATLPIVIVMKDGSGSFAGTDGTKTEFAAAKGCEPTIPAMLEWLEAGTHKAIIVQADREATAAMIHRVVRTAQAAGATDVLFAVKRQ